MEFFPEAHAQTAEATKAAADAAGVFLNQGVLGAVCVLLVIAVGFLFWLLITSHNRYVALVERVITIGEASKNAAEENAEALRDARQPITGILTAIQTLSREIEGEAREVRHGIGSLRSGQEGIAGRLDRIADRPPSDRGRP